MSKRFPLLVREALSTVALVLVIGGAGHLLVRSVEVDGISMLPTVHTGELLFVDTLSYRLHAPRRGDIIILHPPVAPDENYIKRVIGLPGDRVAVKNGLVYINGAALAEPYLHEPHTYSWGPARVPAADYFVLGDNRDASYDSHLWGPGKTFLAGNEIVGRAVLAYWPLSDLHVITTQPALAAKPTH